MGLTCTLVFILVLSGVQEVDLDTCGVNQKVIHSIRLVQWPSVGLPILALPEIFDLSR